jgi:hypothetical protein
MRKCDWLPACVEELGELIDREFASFCLFFFPPISLSGGGDGEIVRPRHLPLAG